MAKLNNDQFHIERFSQIILHFVYAKRILVVLDNVIKEQCSDCKYGRGCLMTRFEKLDAYFDIAFEKVNVCDIIVLFNRTFQTIFGIEERVKKCESWYNRNMPSSLEVKMFARLLVLKGEN